MQKYALLLSYQGQGFCGWQRQGEASGERPSVQESIERAITRMTQESPALVASGRTDAGVHAVAQVAHFKLETKTLPEHNLLRGLNTLLPPEVRVLKVAKVGDDFHAQHGAVKKQYSYYFQLGPAPIAHLGPLSAYHHAALDLEAIQRGLSYLVGEHDFLAFQGSGAKPGPTVREIYDAEATEMAPPFPLENPHPDFRMIRIRIVGSGFLKHMVRGIAGTALQVGEGTRQPEDFRVILETRNRALTGPTALAQGLWLEKVWYPADPFEKR